MTLSGSMAAKCLAYGDRICDVEGAPVTDMEVARTMILKALQKNRAVTLVLERAESVKAKADVEAACKDQPKPQQSVIMASDVHDIVARQKAKLRDLKAPQKVTHLRG